MQYRCVATTVEGFVQQVAVSYVANGYFFYVAGSVPANKDPAAVDAKIIDRYGIAISKWAKARRKALGQANLQYIRHERFFLILATHGTHVFFEEEARVIRDVRRVPIRFAGYSISFRNGHASVRIEATEYRMLKSFFEDLAVKRNADCLGKELRAVTFAPYAPVRRQLLTILRAINRRRKQAGFDPVPRHSLHLRRRAYRPFELSAERFSSAQTFGEHFGETFGEKDEIDDG
ncbi:MAG: hypothetical protein K2X38_09100 [Gemmataceae bacterium]|nr:hypothetical protein [Gemmataceae bacterium]